MTFEPVLPPLVLAAIAAAIVVARIVALQRMPSAARTRVALFRWGGLSLAALLLTVAAVRPVVEPGADGATRVADRDAPNVFLVVDRSPDMLVADDREGRPRTALAQEDVAALIDRYPGARFAVISFAARPTLDWPLSADTWSLRPLASTLEPYPATPGSMANTNAGAAGNMLRYQLIGARQQYPRAKTLVYYFGAGAAEAQTPPREFNVPDAAVDGGAVLGYGTADGGPVPGTDVARSAIDEQSLRDVAEQIGVPYVARSDAGPLDVPGDATAAAPGPAARVDTASRIEVYWLPAALAAVLLLVELYVVLREFRRTRLVNRDVVV
jgi:Ca-activated chloride channel homolog